MGFFLDGKQNYILFHFYLEKKLCKYSTKLKIQRCDWDKKLQRPKAKRGEIGKENRKITNTLNEYQRAYDLLKEKYGISITKEIVRKEFDSYFHNITSEPKTKYYSDYYNEFIKEKREMQSLVRHSIYKYIVVNKRIEELQIKNKTSYTLLDFDNKFFSTFISYLRVDLKISDNTLHRYVKAFKSFLNWCAKNEYPVNKDYKQVKIKEKETSHIALTEDDLIILEEIELPPLQDYYRDLFLIGVYSGQRFSDYHRFNKKYRQENFLKIRAKKTGEFSYIPLTNKLLNLLNKYEWILPKISPQKFNKQIQQICKIAGFTEIIQTDKFYGNKKISKDLPKWKLIASHSARRTFITLSAQRGVPHTLIMQTTGIKSIKTLQGYIKFDQKKLFDSISDAWD